MAVDHASEGAIPFSFQEPEHAPCCNRTVKEKKYLEAPSPYSSLNPNIALVATER